MAASHQPEVRHLIGVIQLPKGRAAPAAITAAKASVK